jgi:hypothetical protein
MWVNPMSSSVNKAIIVTAFIGAIALVTSARADVSGCPPKSPALVLDVMHPPINITLLARALIVYRCNEYDSEFKKQITKAQTWIEQQAPQVANPAIVLDIDETSLSNWDQILHNQFGYFPVGPCDLKAVAPCGQHEWELSAQAVALQPTLDMYNAVRKLKGKDGSQLAVFFVTGRYDDPLERLATEWNLRKVGYDTWQYLYMRTEASRGDKYVSCFKTWARTQIETKYTSKYTIIANIGDQQGDLIGGHAAQAFKLPNPFYFIDGDETTGLGCKPP